MALWLGLTAWILTISYTGRGHIVNESGHIFNILPTAPPDTKRPRILRDLIEICRLLGSNRKTEVGTPPPKSYVPVEGFEKKKKSHIYIYIYIATNEL